MLTGIPTFWKPQNGGTLNPHKTLRYEFRTHRPLRNEVAKTKEAMGQELAECIGAAVTVFGPSQDRKCLKPMRCALGVRVWAQRLQNP